jgi:hypothetical protein
MGEGAGTGIERGRGRGTRPNLTWRKDQATTNMAPAAHAHETVEDADMGVDDMAYGLDDEVEGEDAQEEEDNGVYVMPDEPVLNTLEERERYYKQVCL